MRYYTIPTATGDRRLPSVTTILNATMPTAKRTNLVKAEAKNPLKYYLKVEASRSRGNAVDSYAKCRFLDIPPIRNLDYARQYRHFDKWLAAEFSGGECWPDHLVFDLDKGYAGTLDIVAPLRDGLTLIDIKTMAHKAFPEAIDAAMLQCAAYYGAWSRRSTTPKIDAIAALFVSPYGLEVHSARGEAIALLLDLFYRRCKQFPAAVSAMYS